MAAPNRLSSSLSSSSVHQLVRLGSYIAVLSLWTFVSGSVLPAKVFPPPWTIAEEIGGIVLSGDFLEHAVPTLTRIGLGFALALLIGIAVGVSMRSPTVDSILRHWVTALMSTPGLVFVLVCALVLGFHPAGPVIATVVTAFPFVTANVAEGVRSFPQDLLQMGAVYRASRPRVIRFIVLPYLVPFVLAGARFAFSVSWKTATLAELFGSSAGIGFMMRLHHSSFNVPGLLAWATTFFFVALGIDKLLFATAEHRLLMWRNGESTRKVKA